MADPNITANIGSLDALPDALADTDLLEIERPIADPAPNDNYRLSYGDLKAAIAAAIGSGAQTGDALVTARDPGAGWLEQGRVYSQSAYPALYALVGLIAETPMGSTWASYVPGTRPSTTSLAAACWVTEDIGVAVGNGVIWRTTNGGMSWVSTTVAGSLLCVARVSADVVIAAGLSGVVLRSTDSGATWAAVASGTTSHMRSITVFDVDRIFFHAADNGQNRLSTDGGVTIGAGANTAANICDASVRFSATVAVCFGNGTTAYRTTNAGASWSAVTVPSLSALRGAVAFDHEIGVVSQSNGTTIRSVDSGVTWTTVTTGVSMTSVFAVKRVDANTVAVLSSGGPSAVSFDLGVTWQSTTALTSASASLVIPGKAILAVGNSVQWRSVPVYEYDHTTQFKTPLFLGIGAGFKGYMKA